MSKHFRPWKIDQTQLLPPSVQDFVDADHLARFIVEIVGQLDLGAITRQYSGRGSKAYPAEMMVSVLFYGYATGVFSSRKLERASHDSLAFRYICANTHPDHDTIATFRKRFLGELKDLFVQILLIAQAMGLFELGDISIDGTKIHASASKHSAVSYKRLLALDRQLQIEVDELFALAAQADAEAIPEGMDIANRSA